MRWRGSGYTRFQGALSIRMLAVGAAEAPLSKQTLFQAVEGCAVGRFGQSLHGLVVAPRYYVTGRVDVRATPRSTN